MPKAIRLPPSNPAVGSQIDVDSEEDKTSQAVVSSESHAALMAVEAAAGEIAENTAALIALVQSTSPHTRALAILSSSTADQIEIISANMRKFLEVSNVSG